jgi:hypothetical protein
MVGAWLSFVSAERATLAPRKPAQSSLAKSEYR